ncbi:MAG: hypothetical protein IT244_13480 [Bacteroidia bacterium]|nr:hypothetical protein [Bacteroidia bacterium]
MKYLIIPTFIIIGLFACTKEEPLKYNDYTALRSHLRAHLEVFALSESLSQQLEYNITTNYLNIEGGSIDTLKLVGDILKYKDSRQRKGKILITYDYTLSAPINTFTFDLDYYRDSFHVTGTIKIKELSVPINDAQPKNITGTINFEYLDGKTVVNTIDMVQKPLGRSDYEYTGNIHTKVSNGDSAYSTTIVPIKNTYWDGSNNFSFIRPWFGENELHTSQQKGKGRMIWGYRDDYQFRDDYLYIGFPQDNDLQLNMRMQLY